MRAGDMSTDMRWCKRKPHSVSDYAVLVGAGVNAYLYVVDDMTG